MKEIKKYIAPYWKAVLLIVIFLAAEAYCDLALPQYTSKIIDTGIQSMGIEHILPEKITEKDFHEAEIFMNENEKKLWNESYTKENDIYCLNINDSDRLNEIDNKLLVPVAITHSLGHMKEEDFQKMLKSQNVTGITDIETFTMEDEDGKEHRYVDTLPYFKKMEAAGMADRSVIEEIRKNIEKTIETTGDTAVKSMGKSYAAFAAENAGMDMHMIQKTYLFKSGSKMIAVAFVMLIAAVIVAYLAAKTGAAVGRDLREAVFGKIMSFSNGEMDKFAASSLITRSTNDIQQIQNVTAVILRMVLYAPIIGVGGIYMVAKTKAGMGWIVGLALLVIMGFVILLISLTMPKFKKMQELMDNLNRVSREILTGLPVIRAFKREEKEEERFDVTNRDLRKIQLFTNRVMTMMMPGMLLIMNILVVLITWVSAKKIDSGVLQVGTMTAFITYSMLIVMAFLMMTMTTVMLPRAGASAKRIAEVLTTEVSVKSEEGAEEPETCRGEIEFRNVSFSYPDAKENVLEGISFKAEPGKVTAIIGSTGSGKSTLINLIPRFYDVTEGEILLDGKDIRELPLKYLREKTGFVPQKGILFSGTIESNLRFGAEEADMSQIEEAASVAQAEDFINSKEEKYESYIAQGGNNVSGGQKQRIAIARALAKKPEILIFDDSFSALDMKTDAKLRHELADKVKDVTEIVVAQRISSILHADQIIVLEDGKIAGTGTHSELMKNCSVYEQIAKSQLSEKELGGEI